MPVITDREDAGILVLRFKCLQKIGMALRDVLKFVNKKMTIGALVASLAYMRRGSDDHVLEIDPRSETLLIFGEHRLEYFQKREAT